LLGMAAVLTVSANGVETSPVIRGAWVSENILGVKPPPPPDVVPAIEPDVSGTTTIRQRLAKHSTDRACGRADGAVARRHDRAARKQHLPLRGGLRHRPPDGTRRRVRRRPHLRQSEAARPRPAHHHRRVPHQRRLPVALRIENIAP
ncbi:MAG: DUF1588 domain-containing protein, partial [Alphaproteobacteria bacterium]|nr:DUF1588 domain-containing protein [Alphaproteobacteria bacterium]